MTGVQIRSAGEVQGEEAKMKKLFLLGTFLCAIQARPARAEENSANRMPTAAIMVAVAEGLIAQRCIGAHYKKALADNALETLQLTGRFDGNMMANAIAYYASKISSVPDGTEDPLCAQIRADLRRDPNPFLTFDGK
jgi:hypothetical protein